MYKFFIADLKVTNDSLFVRDKGVLGTMSIILLLNPYPSGRMKEFQPMNEWLINNEVASHYEMTKVGLFCVWHLVIHDDAPAVLFRLFWQQFPLGVPAEIHGHHLASVV